MMNKIKPSQSDEHSLNPQSSILNPSEDLKEIGRLFTRSIQHSTGMSYNPFCRQRGFLMIGAAILIVIVAFISVIAANLALTESRAVTDQYSSAQAFYVAQAGLENGVYSILQGTDCSTITGNASYTNVSFGTGKFTLTGMLYQPATVATLSSGITATSTVIPVTTVTNYAPYGRVQVDAELLDYYQTSTNAATCGGTAPCLLVMARGAYSTTASAHSLGAQAQQKQCHLKSQGILTGVSSVPVERDVMEEVFFPVGGTGWIVGDHSSSKPVILQWNGSTWADVGTSTSFSALDLDSVVLVDATTAWAVGNATSGALFIRWNGSAWSRVSSTVSSENLLGIDCVNSSNCHAVGGKRTFGLWNGASWTNATRNANVSDATINGVSCTAANNCWAAATKSGRAFLIKWNGTEWSRASVSLPNVSYYGVSCISANDCWVVGEAKSFAHYDGTSWSAVTPSASVPNNNFTAVSCPASNSCWAIANQSASDATLVYWNGTSWTRVLPDASVPAKNLYGVNCNSVNDCWAVGQESLIVHWNGSAWTKFTPSGTIPSVNLRSVSKITGASSSPHACLWEEQF